MAPALRAAAQAANVELPERISLPLSFTTPEAPSDSVAVFSGAEREKITEVDFAEGDTQAGTGETSASPRVEDRPLRSELPWSILMAAGVPLAVNVVTFGVAVLVGWERVFSLAWPAELFLVAGSLSLIMGFAEALWMMAPVGIVAGNGLIFLYCTLTGNWRHWIFLWAFDLWLIGGMVWLTIWLRRHSGRRRELSRMLGRVLGPCLFALGVLVFALTIIGVATFRVIR
jgi:hypothetical protein